MLAIYDPPCIFQLDVHPAKICSLFHPCSRSSHISNGDIPLMDEPPLVPWNSKEHSSEARFSIVGFHILYLIQLPFHLSCCHAISPSIHYFYLYLPPFIMSIYLSIYLPTYLSIYLSVYLSIYLYIYLSIYLFIYLSIYLFIYMSIYLPIYLYIYKYVYIFICISIYLSIYLIFIYLTVSI